MEHILAGYCCGAGGSVSLTQWGVLSHLVEGGAGTVVGVCERSNKENERKDWFMNEQLK